MPMTLTTSPVWGAWIIWPPPMYMPTWLIGLWVKIRSPGCTSDGSMWVITAYCWRDWCGSDTPAWAHAHAVSPEQSKPFPGDEVAK